MDGLRTDVLRRATQSHEYKYLAAGLEERRHADPRWAPWLLAPMLGYLPGRRERATEVYRRSEHALKKAGLP